MKAPETHRISVERAMQTLDYIEMVALSQMYERWAFTESNLDGDQRTLLIQLSSDYENVAAFCGPGWEASAAENPPDAVAYAARLEVISRGRVQVAGQR